MDPVYEFIGTTNSTKFSKKIKDKEIQKNRVFVIKKTLHDGTVSYGEYSLAKVNSMTIALRCVNRKCHSVLTIESAHEIIVEKTHIERNGKKRNIYNFSTTADLTDDSKYARPHHIHTKSVKCQSFNRNNECKSTIHNENCPYEKLNCPINQRKFSEKAIQIARNDPSVTRRRYQTLIITIKHEVGERVFLYPVTLM